MTGKPLFIPLKTEFFEAFERGEKTTEYRMAGPRWNAKTCRVGRKVTLSHGYSPKRRLYGTVKAFYEDTAVCMTDAWIACYGPSDALAACIVIELEPKP